MKFNNETRLNQLASEVKPFLSLGTNPKIHVSPAGQPLYDELITSLIPYAEKLAHKYAQNQQVITLDEAQLLSIALIEGMYKAFKLWTNPDYRFMAIYTKSVNYCYQTYKRDQLTDKRKAISTYMPTDIPMNHKEKNSDYIGDSLEYIDMGLPSAFDLLQENEFIQNLKDKLSPDDFTIACILMYSTHKDIGQAFAKAFNETSYNGKLRVKVNRAKERIAKVVTN